ALASAIEALDRVEPHLERVNECLRARPQADFGAVHIVPADWHFERPPPELLRDEEHFHIEAEAFQLLPREDVAGGIRLEELEAALRVAERQPGDHAHD